MLQHDGDRQIRVGRRRRRRLPFDAERGPHRRIAAVHAVLTHAGEFGASLVAEVGHRAHDHHEEHGYRRSAGYARLR